MKKYTQIDKITREYLSGKLEKLTMDYKDSDSIIVSIEYEDKYHYRYDYDLEIDPETNVHHFLSHQSAAVLYRINLDRDQKFETAVCNLLLSAQ